MACVACAALTGAAGFAAASGLAGGAAAAVGLPTTTVTVSTPVATATVTTPVVTTPVVTTTVSTPPVTTAVTTTVATPVTTATVSSSAPPAATTTATQPAGTATPTAGGGVGSAGGGTGGGATGGSSSAPSAGGGETAGAATAVGGSGSVHVRAARRGSRRPARLVVVLPRPAIVLLVFRGPGRSCDVAGTVRVRGARGRNAVPITGRVGGGRVRSGRLPEGLFRLEVYAVTASSRPALLGRLTIALAYSSGRARARQVARELPACARGSGTAVGGSAAAPVAGERSGGPGSMTAANDRGSAAAFAPTGGGVAAFRGGRRPEPQRAGLPTLEDADAIGGFAAWALAGLTAASLLLFLGLLGSQVLRSLRG